MDWKNMSKGGKLLRLGLLGGALLLSGGLAFLYISGEIDLKRPSQFLNVGDGEIQIGTNTIRISRYRLNMGGNKIMNLKEPIEAADAATKGYVDAAATGPVFTISCGWITSGNPPAVGSCTPAACPVDYLSTDISCRVLALATSVSGWGGDTGANNYKGKPSEWYQGLGGGGNVEGSGGASGECYRTCYK